MTQITTRLNALSSQETARQTAREVRTIKGIHGVRSKDLSVLIQQLHSEQQHTLIDNLDDLDHLFGNSYEEGLIAIGLLATLLPNHPHDVLEMSLDWLNRVDDHQTADALGWLLVGPGMLATQTPYEELFVIAKQTDHPIATRSVIISGLAALPEPIIMTSASALSAHLNAQVVRFVDEPLSPIVNEILVRYYRRSEPVLRKALRRLVGAWATHDPDSALKWKLEMQKMGGMHKMLSTEIERKTKKRRPKP